MTTTFATKTVCAGNYAIATIESEIAKLQSQLTALQEQQQTVKSAEQQGLSAINQYKQAIATIAQLNEPEMLQSFLEEMATITNDAIGDRSRLPETDDDIVDDDIVESPNTNPSSLTLSDVIVEAVNNNHLDNEAETDDLHNDNQTDDNPTDNNYSEWSVTDRQQVNNYKRNRLIQFCSVHNVKFQPRDKKAEICQRIEAKHYDVDYVIDWLQHGNK